MKYLNVVLLFWGLLLTTFSTFAQGYKVRGHITDLQSHQPIPGLMIMTKDSTAHAVSDTDGDFLLEPTKPEGDFWVFGIGYQTRILHYSQNQGQLNIQLTPDTRSLNTVKITALGDNKSIRETAGSIAVLSGSQLKTGDGTSIQNAINTIPGVRLDHSNGEDSKISIRGEGVRSPWGIRNVKIYVNDIPLTETDGTSRIEGLDVSDLGQLEVIKGPASSLYGGGTGGVLKFQLDRAAYQEQSIEASGLYGAYNLNRESVNYREGGDKFNSYLSVGRQFTDGFRDHSRDIRKFVAGNFQWFPDTKRIITLLVTHSEQNAQIPGALTLAQVKENPRQAAQSYLDNEAGRREKWTRLGVGQQYDFNNHFSNSTSIFTYFYGLDHPLPFGLINNTYQSYGGRTKFTYNAGFKTLPTVFIFGGEYTQAYSKGNIYFNNHGEPNGVMSNTDYNNRSYSIFYQSETSIGKVVDVVLGLSLNGLTYNSINFLHPEQSGVKNFTGEWAPRLAVSHHFANWLSLHGSISSGFDNPSSDQIQNPDRSINRDLRSEKGVNYEIDAKGNFVGDRFNYDLSLFRMNMSGEFIGQSFPTGVTVYHNSGRTAHNGIELALSYQVIKDTDHKVVKSFRPYLSVTYSDFKFKDYTILDENNEVVANYDGNKLTGISPWMVAAGADLEMRAGFYAHADLFYNAEYPLNDANSDYNPAYTIINTQIGYRRDFGKYFGINLYTGVNNLTNRLYSSFTDLNAVPDATGQTPYFYVAPMRNAFVGADFKFYLKPKN